MSNARPVPVSLPLPSLGCRPLLLPLLGGAQLVILTFLLLVGCRGRGVPLPWLFLLLALEAAGWAFLPTGRSQRLKWLRGLWRDVASYPHSGRVPWGGALVFVVLPAGALLNLGNYSPFVGDTKPVMLAAVSLVHNGDVELSEYVGHAPRPNLMGSDGDLPYYLRRTPRGIYSSYPSGMMIFAVPTAAVARLTGADLSRARDWGMEKWTASWVAGGCLGIFFLLALHRVAPRPALLMTLLLATGSVVCSTVGQALWQHGGTILFTLTLLFLEFHHHHRPTRWTVPLQGLAAALAVACRLSSVLFVLPFAVWLLARAPRRALALTLSATCAYVPWALFYISLYGTPFGPSTSQMVLAHWSGEVSDGILGMLVSPGRGLFLYQPWLILLLLHLVPGLRGRLVATGRSSEPSGWGICCAVAAALHLALVGTWQVWWGGHCWGSRLASEVIPLAALGLRPVAFLWSLSGGRRFLLGLGLLSAFFHLSAVYLEADQWNPILFGDQAPEQLWSWRRAPFLFPFEHGLR